MRRAIKTYVTYCYSTCNKVQTSSKQREGVRERERQTDNSKIQTLNSLRSAACIAT
jgi:hypothetical protein